MGEGFWKSRGVGFGVWLVGYIVVEWWFRCFWSCRICVDLLVMRWSLIEGEVGRIRYVWVCILYVGLCWR